MNIKSIEEKACAMMKQSFDKYVRRTEELCGDIEVKKVWMEGEEVRLILNIQKRTLQYYRDSGKLAFSRIGNKCFYKTSDVQKLISDSQIK